jgi:hypothetical protein
MELQIKEGKYNPVLAEYCSTYSGSAGIQLFLKMSKISRNCMFEMSKSKEIKREDKRQKLVETQ